MARYILEIVLQKVDVHVDQVQKMIYQARNEANLWEDKARRVEKKQNYFLFASSIKG